MFRLQNYINISLFLFILLGLNLPSKPQNPPDASQSYETRFFCGSDDDYPATIARTPRGDIPIIIYKHSPDSNSYITKRKCELTSARFQRLFDTDNLSYFTSGKVDRHPVICATRNSDQVCSSDNVLLTFSPNTTQVEIDNVISHLINIKRGSASSNLIILRDTKLGFQLHGDPTTLPSLHGDPTTLPPPPTK